MTDISRRAAIGSLMGVGLAASAALIAAPPEHDVKYGYVTPDNCAHVTGIGCGDVRVYLDGKDITNRDDRRERIMAADDIHGFVEVLDWHDGRGYVTGPDGFLKRRRIYGTVKIRHKDDRT